MATRHQKSVSPLEIKKLEKSPAQLAQWAAYEALCIQRELEAKATRARKRQIDAIHSSVLDFQRANELRRFAVTVMGQVDPLAPIEVLQRAQAWQAQVLELADSLDPVDAIVAGFSDPV